MRTSKSGVPHHVGLFWSAQRIRYRNIGESTHVPSLGGPSLMWTGRVLGPAEDRLPYSGMSSSLISGLADSLSIRVLLHAWSLASESRVISYARTQARVCTWNQNSSIRTRRLGSQICPPSSNQAESPGLLCTTSG